MAAVARKAGSSLAFLLLVYILNFVDRQIVSILAVPIRTELHLSDTQLGLMGGLAFALLYTTVGIPVAWLADRGSRRRIIGWSLALWSLFTALCGAAQGFTQLFLARVGVGLGEAGGVAPSYALISQMVEPRRQARAFAIFSFGIPIGASIGIFLGGWIASAVGWRAAFAITGLAGLAILPGLKLLPESTPEQSGPLPFRAALIEVAGKPILWFLAFAAGLGSIPGYGLLFWLPSFFSRTLHFSLIHTSILFGSIVLIGGLAGTWLGGWSADRAARRGPAAYPLVPAISLAVAAPLFAAGLLGASPWITIPAFLLGQALSLTWLGPVTAAVQQLYPERSRALAAAVFLFVNNLIGLGLGTSLFGILSDRLRPNFGDESLRYALLVGLALYFLSALIYWAAAGRIGRHWTNRASDT